MTKINQIAKLVKVVKVRVWKYKTRCISAFMKDEK